MSDHVNFLKNTYSQIYPDHVILGVDLHAGNVVLHCRDGDGHRIRRKFCFVMEKRK